MDPTSASVDRNDLFYDCLEAFDDSDSDRPPPPASYLRHARGDVERARADWEATLLWRAKENVGGILSSPHPVFRKIKATYPHTIHGLSRDGYPVVYEQPGQMDLKALFQDGCPVSDVVRHYVFFMEYLSNRICGDTELRRSGAMASGGPKPGSADGFGFVVVMDMRGVSVSHLSADVLKYMNRASDINKRHYPMSMKRVIAVNVTGILAAAWSGVKRIVPKAGAGGAPDIASDRYLAALEEIIATDQIPPEFGGSSPYTLGAHPYEVGLWNLVDSVEHHQSDEKVDIAAREEEPNDNKGMDKHLNSQIAVGTVQSEKTTEADLHQEKLQAFLSEALFQGG